MPALAQGADEDKLNERVSAASCQPRLSSDRAKLTFSGTDWVFASGQTGTVILECPVFTDWEDDTTGQRSVQEVRLWYLDSDGFGPNAQVKAELRFIEWGLGSLTSQLVGDVNSNNSNTMIQTQRGVSAGGDLMEEAQYFVVVTMVRLNVNVTVRFRGVSFFQEP